MRTGLILLVLFLGLGFVAGCERRIAKDELGTVEFDADKLPGADKPFPMPQLGPEPPPDENSLHRHRH